jgi:hypothetical protein
MAHHLSDHTQRITMQEVVVQLAIIQPPKTRGLLSVSYIFGFFELNIDLTEPILAFEDLERPIVDVLHTLDMVVPQLLEAVAALGITLTVDLCRIDVCYLRRPCSHYIHGFAGTQLQTSRFHPAPRARNVCLRC